MFIMKSSFFLASLLSLAIAAPLVPSLDDSQLCTYELGFCVQSVEGVSPTRLATAAEAKSNKFARNAPVNVKTSKLLMQSSKPLVVRTVQKSRLNVVL
jgi:hypothetical protein